MWINSPNNAELMRPAGAVSSVEVPGMLSPKEPANRAAPQVSRTERRHESGGPISEIRVHGFLHPVQPPGISLLLADRPTAYRVSPAGYERKLAAASGKDVLGRTDPRSTSSRTSTERSRRTEPGSASLARSASPRVAASRAASIPSRLDAYVISGQHPVAVSKQ
jgi:hypothetical protein